MRPESSSLRSVSADPLFRLELTKYLVPIVSAQPQHTLLRAHLDLPGGGVVYALPELPAQYAKHILQLSTYIQHPTVRHPQEQEVPLTPLSPPQTSCATPPEHT